MWANVLDLALGKHVDPMIASYDPEQSNQISATIQALCVHSMPLLSGTETCSTRSDHAGEGAWLKLWELDEQLVCQGQINMSLAMYQRLLFPDIAQLAFVDPGSRFIAGCSSTGLVAIWSSGSAATELSSVCCCHLNISISCLACHGPQLCKLMIDTKTADI